MNSFPRRRDPTFPQGLAALIFLVILVAAVAAAVYSRPSQPVTPSIPVGHTPKIDRIAQLRAEIAKGLPPGTLVRVNPRGPRTSGAVWVVRTGSSVDVLMTLVGPNRAISFVTDANIAEVDRILRPGDPGYTDAATRFLSQM